MIILVLVILNETKRNISPVYIKNILVSQLSIILVMDGRRHLVRLDKIPDGPVHVTRYKPTVKRYTP